LAKSSIQLVFGEDELNGTLNIEDLFAGRRLALLRTGERNGLEPSVLPPCFCAKRDTFFFLSRIRARILWMRCS
jgi:hypothetical protein